MFADSEQTDADILSGDADNLSDFLVAEVLEPQQYDGAVEGLQLGDALVEHVHLAGVLIAVFKQIDVHGHPNGGCATLLTVERNAGVEGNAVDPRSDVGAMLEALEAFPKID